MTLLTRIKNILGRNAEIILLKTPSFLMPGIAIEAVARSCSCFFHSRDDDGIGIEDRLRGMLCASIFKSKGLRIGRGIRLERLKAISLHDNVTLYGPRYISATGTSGYVTVGHGTHIDRLSVVYGQGGVEIGCGCAIAAGVIIYSQTSQYNAFAGLGVVAQGTKYASVKIGNDVWIGAGAIILPGVSIGDHAVIGAGSVVTGDIETSTVAVGAPARPVGNRKNIV